MEVRGIMDKEFSGKLGNFVFYRRNGKTFVRRVAIPGKPRKWETEGRTERQKAVTNRFGKLQQLYRFYRERVSADIWRLAGREEGKTSSNLFHSVNHACFDGEGRMTKPELFQFSRGVLVLPPALRVESLGEARFRVTWGAEEEYARAAGNDRLQVGVLYDGNMPATRLALSVKGLRADGQGEFLLERYPSGGAHVYLFFAREDGTAYSPSFYARVAEL